MAITKREKRDLHILMHQLRVRVDNLTKGKERDHNKALESINLGINQLNLAAARTYFANNKRNLKRKKRNER
jgi:hypothetical protein